MNQKDFENLRKDVHETALRMVKFGLVVAKQGNVSARVQGEEIAVITPTKIPYEKMSPNDIAVVTFNEELVLGALKPSKETKMHLAVYRARQDVGAIVHTHSPYATAASSLRISIPPFLEEQIPYLGGEIKTAEYARSGTEELGSYIVEALGDREGALLANHGVIACGANLTEALRNAILVERISQVFMIATFSGEVMPLPPKSVEVQRKSYLERKGNAQQLLTASSRPKHQ